MVGESYYAMPCDKIAFMFDDRNTTLSVYPDCAEYFSGRNPSQQVAVKADMIGSTNIAQAAAALCQSFGVAMWLALVIHMIGVEIYVKLP